MNYSINYRILFLVIISLLFSGVSFSQHEIKVPRSSLKVGMEGYADALENIAKGDKWSGKGKGAIPKALEFYLKAYEYNATCPELNCKIGACYLQTDKKAKAVTYLQSAYDKNKTSVKEITYLLARAYHYNTDFEKAAQLYDEFYKSLKERHKEKFTTTIFKYIEECKNGMELKTKSARAVVKNLDSAINSAYSDYHSVIVGNDSVMYFTSRRPHGKRSKPDKTNYLFKEDVYSSFQKEGEWSNAEYLTDRNFNTKHNEAIVWVSDNGETCYLYDGTSRMGDFYASTLKNGKWTSPRRLPRKFNSKKSESCMSITADGKFFYFVSTLDKENFGGKDIFYTRLNTKGKWEKPRNLGKNINTRFDEDFVNISPDGKVLYFSSKGHNSMGGYDIYRSEISANGTWSKPENLGFPVNTPDEDISFTPMSGEKKGYFSSMRPEGLGGFDIYQVIFLGAEKQLILKTDEQAVAYFYKPITDIFARISGEMKIDTTYILKGIITDAAKNTPIVARLNLIDADKGQVIAAAISDSTGAYQVRLNQLKSYGVELNAQGYMFYLDVITFPAKITTREIIKNFKMNKIKAGAKIVLKNIYFETGKAVLTSESFIELDKVVSFLVENNELKIEISGHTDNVGGAAYNVKLSGNRAQAVVDYLISKGIPREQLVSKGYGPNQPISPNTTAKGRQLNRRVEFKILSVE